MTNYFEYVDRNVTEIGRLLHVLIHTDQRTEALNYFRRKVRPQGPDNYPLLAQDMFELLKSHFVRTEPGLEPPKANGKQLHEDSPFDMRVLMTEDHPYRIYCEQMRPHVEVFFKDHQRVKSIFEVEDFLDQLIIEDGLWRDLSKPQQAFLRTIASRYYRWTNEQH